MGKQSQRVVVVGGSFAGRRVERLLRGASVDDATLEVTLVDAKGFWEYHPGACRALVEPAQAKRLVLPQPERTVIATVESVDAPASEKDGRGVAPALRLNNGETLTFDYCVLCTGSSYVAPIKPAQVDVQTPEARCKQFEGAHEKLANATNVVVVGGGFVGVELAAEVVGKWGKQKKVTMVLAGDALLERMHPSVGQAAKRWLEARGVAFLMEQRVDMARSTESVVVTEGGARIEADLVYYCLGFQPSSLPLKANYPHALAENGGVKVNPFMQVDGLHNVFAVGDCVVGSDEKNALTADLGATLVASNIKRMASGEQLLVFPQGVCHGMATVPIIACVSLYKWSGVMQFNQLVLTGFLPAMVKALIEFLQLSTAAEQTVPTGIWDMIEQINIFLGRYLFLPSGKQTTSKST